MKMDVYMASTLAVHVVYVTVVWCNNACNMQNSVMAITWLTLTPIRQESQTQSKSFYYCDLRLSKSLKSDKHTVFLFYFGNNFGLIFFLNFFFKEILSKIYMYPL